MSSFDITWDTYYGFRLIRTLGMGPSNLVLTRFLLLKLIGSFIDTEAFRNGTSHLAGHVGKGISIMLILKLFIPLV